MRLSQSVILETLLILASLVPVAATQTSGTQPLPSGTAVPIVFSHTLDASKLKVGDFIQAKTTQVILLPGGERIPRGAKLDGKIVAGRPLTSQGPSELSFRFDTLAYRNKSVPVQMRVRAMASFVDSSSVMFALIDYGNQDNSLFGQVGGDTYIPNDAVHSPSGAQVGKATGDGVFAKLTASEESHSKTSISCGGNEALQSVGIFSSGACGLYGFDDLSLDEPGTNDGTIQFHSDRHAAKIARGTVALMQVVSSPE